MTSSGWSRLLLGTILATSVFGPASAQTASAPETTLAAAERAATSHSTPDMKIDPATLADHVEAALAAARAADTITTEEVDRILTGSIAAIRPGPQTGGLTELTAPKTNALSDPKVAPEPSLPQPASLAVTAPTTGPVRTETNAEPAPQPNPAPAAAPAAEAKPIATEVAPKAVEGAAPAATDGSAVPPTAASEASPAATTPVPPPAPAAEAVSPSPVVPEKAAEVTPTAEPVKPAETAIAMPPTPATVDAAAAPTVVTPTPAPAEAPAAPEKAAEATPATEAPKPVNTAAVAPSEASAPTVETSVATTSPAATAPVAAHVEPTPSTAAGTPEVTAAVAPSVSVTPSMSGTYSTASEPVAATAEPPVAAAVPAPPIAVAPIATATPAAEAVPVTPVREPLATATTLPAAATATTVPTATTTTAAAPAAPAPVAAPKASTDAAIAATLAAEQAAAALKTALEEIQPLAGPAEERADRAAILAFYADRAFLPLFVDAQGTTDRARGALAALARAGEDGLEPHDYTLPRYEAGLAPEARAKAEIAFAQTTVRFARHLQSGRFDPGRVNELVTPTPPKTEAREVLDHLAGTTATAAALQSYAPTHSGYLRLKAMLADLRGAAPEPPMVMVPAGPTLKPGQRDARVALLRERLGVEVVSDAEIYDPSLAAAVKAFQRDRGLNPSGAVGRDTITALNGEKTGTASRIADLISNMERWRWLPRDLGELHVFVNVPDFHLDVMKDGRSIHHARVIVGRPSNPTPIFSEEMKYVVVNPYWNVPYSIVKKEMIGKAQASAGTALSRGGWEVEVGRQRVDPTTVDWSTVDASKVTIRQLPGSGNALGNIKFLFPNRHAVYLHDTSSRGLFSQNFRALSHGCVRVHEPFSFADAVLSEEPEKTDGAKLKKMIGGGEKTINLKRLVPVHITYFTAWVDDAGQLQTRPDFYGHDARVKRLLEM